MRRTVVFLAEVDVPDDSVLLIDVLPDVLSAYADAVRQGEVGIKANESFKLVVAYKRDDREVITKTDMRVIHGVTNVTLTGNA